MGKKNKKLNITDNMGNIDDIILDEEIRLLLPYADSLLAPILKNELTQKKCRSKLKVKSSTKNPTKKGRK